MFSTLESGGVMYLCSLAASTTTVLNYLFTWQVESISMLSSLVLDLIVRGDEVKKDFKIIKIWM
jgi:hypothetical protein